MLSLPFRWLLLVTWSLCQQYPVAWLWTAASAACPPSRWLALTPPVSPHRLRPVASAAPRRPSRRATGCCCFRRHWCLFWASSSFSCPSDEDENLAAACRATSFSDFCLRLSSDYPFNKPEQVEEHVMQSEHMATLLQLPEVISKRCKQTRRWLFV